MESIKGGQLPRAAFAIRKSGHAQPSKVVGPQPTMLCGYFSDEMASLVLHSDGHGWPGHGLADDRFLFRHAAIEVFQCVPTQASWLL